ncbi:MAG: lactoylglutathione lyase [Ferruginibacter sp.]|nr:lactoylglutathione lyase [Ferruginibacter sp.]
MHKRIFIFIIIAGSFLAGFGLNAILHPQPADPVLKRVTGVGGIFFKSQHPKKLKAWYRDHLGLQIDQYGTTFEWRLATDSTKKGFTQWAAFNDSTKYFSPSVKDFMINYRVADLRSLLIELKKEQVTIVDTIEEYDYGKFLHIMDEEGNKIELWEPVDKVYDQYAGGRTK